MRRAGAEVHTPSARREVITAEVMDTEKNRCENRTTVVADKPDYRVLNLHFGEACSMGAPVIAYRHGPRRADRRWREGALLPVHPACCNASPSVLLVLDAFQ
jgi:hypothetical protein